VSNCQYAKLLNAYYDGELPLEQRQALEQHLPACASCTTELNELQSLSRVLKLHERQHLASEALDRLHALVHEVPEQSVVRFVWRVAAVAASILFVGVTWLQVGSAQADTTADRVQSWEAAVRDPSSDSPSVNESSDAQLASYIVSDFHSEQRQ